MQSIAAIHGFDARDGARGQGGLLLGPLGFKGRTFGQAPGFGLTAAFLSTKAIRRGFCCSYGAAAANPVQGSDLGGRMREHHPR